MRSIAPPRRQFVKDHEDGGSARGRGLSAQNSLSSLHFALAVCIARVVLVVVLCASCCGYECQLISRFEKSGTGEEP